MKYFVFLVLVLSLLFSSCAPATQLPEPTVTPTKTPNPTATATITLTPTPTLPDIVLQIQKEGIPDVLYDGVSNQIIFKTARGAISVSPESIVNDNGVYVVKQNSETIAVYDPSLTTEMWGRKWIVKSDVIQTDVRPGSAFWPMTQSEMNKAIQEDAEKYIKLNTWDEYFEAVTLEKRFWSPFPPDTYYPPKDKIVRDWEDVNAGDGVDFTYLSPWGRLDDLSKSPFRKDANHFMLLPNEAEGRSFFMAIQSIQVYNKYDGGFGSLHCGYSGKNEGDAAQWSIGATQFGDELLLPSNIRPNGYGWTAGVLFFLKKFNNQFKYQLMDPNSNSGNLTGLHSFVLDWIDQERVPADLEMILLNCDRRSLVK